MIEKSSGIISLKNSASLIKSVIGLQNPFILTVEASEIVAINEVVDESKSSSQAQIAFVIVALHNRPPTFSSLTLSGFLEENSPIMTAVRWNNYSLPKVSDPDSGLNGTVDLELNSEQFFTIQPNWGIRQVMFSILSKNPIIDYEIGQREVNLIVRIKITTFLPCIINSSSFFLCFLNRSLLKIDHQSGQWRPKLIVKYQLLI